MKKISIGIISIILISFAVGILLYPQMPDMMASHWNTKGEVDSYMSKFWGLFLMPLVVLLMFLLYIIIPKIDPLRKNIKKFRKYFDCFIFVVVLFLFYIYILTILWSFRFRFRMPQAILPALAVLFFCAAMLLKKAKQNWFIGIRTPWTLSNKTVWEKTHKLGSRIFIAIAALFLIAAFFQNYAIHIALWPTLAGVFYLILYSYIEYRKIKK